MSEFTKGPWFIDKNEDGEIPDYDGGFASISSAAPCEWRDLARVVIRVEDGEEFEQDGLANARLISAAPDLYEALVNTRNELMLCAKQLEYEGYLVSDCGSVAIALKKADAALAKARGGL